MSSHSAPSEVGASPGGLVRLTAHWAPFGTRVTAAWAVACGAIGSRSVVPGGEGWLRLAIVALLVDVGWGTLWAALGGTDWAAPVGRWRSWPIGGRVVILPYVREGTWGDALSRWLGRFRAWWRQDLWPSCGGVLSSVAVALPIAALLALSLGGRVVLVSMAALAAMQLGVAFARGSGRPSPGWNAVVMVMLPWLAGHAAFAPMTLTSAGLGVAFGIAFAAAEWACAAWGIGLLILSYIVLATLLVVAGAPLAAAAVILVLLPQVALSAWLRRGYPPSAYVRFTRLWLLVSMGVAAVAL